MSIQRASAADLAQRACDVGPLPTQVGALLVLDRADGLDPAEVRAAVRDRLGAVPRMHQHLVEAPRGCGRPYWADDPIDDPLEDRGSEASDGHVAVVRCPGAGDERALLDLLARLVATRLPPGRSPWSLTFVTDVEGGQAAMIIVFDHVLADGIGGLAVLAELVDGPPRAPGTRPRAAAAPTPITSGELLRDATSSRLRSLRHLPRTLGRLREALVELGPQAVVRTPRSSLQQPVGARRNLAVVRADLRAVVAAAHAHHATVNDVVVTAATASLDRLLQQRGEHVSSMVVSVPVSGRAAASATNLGNQVGVMPLSVPTGGTREERLEQVAEISRAHKRRVRGASVMVTTPMMRALGALHLIGWFMNHQRSVTTFLTNLHGPDEQLSFLGAPIIEAVVSSGIYGNVSVGFAVLSYAGTLGITITTDAAACPDGRELERFLQEELDALTAPNLVGAAP
ncbi:MAG: wax ester/triacylglycerol synthase domain-containing protein [Acidimicrobiales bacterium]